MSKPVKIIGALVALVVVAVVAIGVITKLRSDDPDLATEAPQIPTTTASSGTSSTPAAAATSPAGASSAPTIAAGTGTGAPATGAMSFVIDPSQSSAKYVVQETLRGLEATAVGTTSAISGQIHLTPLGLAPTQPSTFRVDLSMLKSDESMRDNFLRQNVLQTSNAANRYAEFTIASVSGFPNSYVEGQEVSLTLTGTMKIRNQTRNLTWQVKARQAGDFLTATADTDFNMTDFGIDPPNVQIARAKDGVHVQVVFVAKRA